MANGIELGTGTPLTGYDGFYPGGVRAGDVFSLPGISTSPLTKPPASVISDAFKAAGINSDSLGGTLAGISAPSPGAPSDGAASAATANPSGVAGYFIRATIIILGFVFVAVGLTMLRPHTQMIIEKVKGR